jgi:hypothetical protein
LFSQQVGRTFMGKDSQIKKKDEKKKERKASIFIGKA